MWLFFQFFSLPPPSFLPLGGWPANPWQPFKLAVLAPADAAGDRLPTHGAASCGHDFIRREESLGKGLHRGAMLSIFKHCLSHSSGVRRVQAFSESVLATARAFKVVIVRVIEAAQPSVSSTYSPRATYSPWQQFVCPMGWIGRLPGASRGIRVGWISGGMCLTWTKVSSWKMAAGNKLLLQAE